MSTQTIVQDRTSMRRPRDERRLPWYHLVLTGLAGLLVAVVGLSLVDALSVASAIIVGFLLHLLLHRDRLLLVLATLVLEPDPDDARTQSRHFHELLFHQGVGSRVRSVARPQRVQLLLVQHGADARRLAVGAAALVSRATTSSASHSLVRAALRARV